MAITITLNGSRRQIDAETDTPLLWALRENCGLPGTQYGCGAGQRARGGPGRAPHPPADDPPAVDPRRLESGVLSRGHGGADWIRLVARVWRLLWLAGVAAGAAGAVGAAQQPAGPAPALTAPPPVAAAAIPESAAYAQALLDALRQISGMPGLGAAVWSDGRLLWQGGSGWCDAERGIAVGPEGHFRLASVSKLLTATAAAWLEERGRLDLDAPLPATPFAPGHAGQTITPRQLAAHLSGLPHYQALDAGRGGRAYRNSREALALVADRELLAPPGQRYFYSSWGYTLLGAAIEQASGQDLWPFLAQNIVPGLAFDVDQADSGAAPFCRAYVSGLGRWRLAAPHDYSYSLGGAGLAATPGALASWGGAVMTGRVVAPATLRRMFEPLRRADGEPLRQGAAQVALGWRVQTTPEGRPMIHHAGATNGARSALVLLPDSAVAVSLMANATGIRNIEDSARTLAEVFLPPSGASGGGATGTIGTAICPAPHERWWARLDALELRGLVVATRAGRSWCESDLELDVELPVFRNGGPVAGGLRLRLILRGGAEGLLHAALATPVGLFGLRAAGQGTPKAAVGPRPWTMGWGAPPP